MGRLHQSNPASGQLLLETESRQSATQPILVQALLHDSREVILNEQGAIQHIAITEESDSIALDRALINAFQKAGPFENPPTPLVQDDGTYALPTMAFTVETGPARIPYATVNPRQGVQFLDC